MSKIKMLLQPSYVLHRRPYLNSSLIVTALTRDFGVVNFIARGARRASSPFSYMLHPFYHITINCSGKTNLLNLSQCDLVKEKRYKFSDHKILFGLYINELVIKLLHEGDPCRKLFHAYQSTIEYLLTKDDVEIGLRVFERVLLEEIGFGLDFTKDNVSGKKIEDNTLYNFLPDVGFFQVDQGVAITKKTFQGYNLKAIGNNDFASAEIIKDAKYIMRIALSNKMKNKKLNTRELFKSVVNIADQRV